MFDQLPLYGVEDVDGLTFQDGETTAIESLKLFEEADRFDELTPQEWIFLLTFIPSFAYLCNCNKFSTTQVVNLLHINGSFERFVCWSNIAIDDWSYVIKAHPKYTNLGRAFCIIKQNKIRYDDIALPSNIIYR